MSEDLEFTLLKRRLGDWLGEPSASLFAEAEKYKVKADELGESHRRYSWYSNMARDFQKAGEFAKSEGR